MENKRFTEEDWKLFRKKLPGWQEAYMERLNKEYIELLSGDAAASEKFWALDARIREDRRRGGVSMRMSRSLLIHNLIQLIEEGAITPDDLAPFSPELRETVAALAGMVR